MSTSLSESFELVLLDTTELPVKRSVLLAFIKEVNFDKLHIPLYRGLTPDPRANALKIISAKLVGGKLVAKVSYEGIMGRFLYKERWGTDIQIRPLLKGHHVSRTGLMDVTKILGFTVDTYRMYTFSL